jgi:Zn-dependent peptidase ImmA (M78 family)/transcriptional regulator with XRE-family HTH domain
VPTLTEATAVAAAFDPGRLTLARQAAGLLKKDLAEKLGVTAAAVTQYELGQSRPSPAVLTLAAQALAVDRQFFVAGRPRLPLDGSSAHFRSLRATRQYEREQALATVSLLWEITSLLETVVRLPAVRLPAVPAGSPASAAAAVRRHWKIPDGPLPHLIRRIEAAGAVVALTAPEQASRRVDAFSCQLTNRPIVVLTADKASIFRRRWNAAHELGHLLLHAEPLPADREQERQAHAFAGELLAPTEQIGDLLPARADLPALLSLQREWGVSVAALLRRGRDCAVYSDAVYRRGMITLTRLGWRQTEPGDDTPGELPSLLGRATELAADAGLPLSELARRVGLPLPRVRQLLGLATDGRPALRLVE